MQTNPQDILKTLSLSFEVFPPKKWEDFPGLYETLDELKGLHPEFISCTYGAGGSNSKKTAEIASHIENELGIRSIAHLTCAALTEDKLLSTIENFKNAGIHSVLALRGDKPFDMSEEDFANRQYKHPSEIIPILKKAGFRVAAACYPEKHEEAPNMDTDIYWLKKKMEMGAEYAVTQLFYDNRKYFDFVERARQAGVTIPIIPGIKPFKKLSQLSMIPKTFKVDLPEELTQEVLKCNTDAEAQQVGIEWCVQQCKELIAHGVPSLHFYSVGATDSIREVAKQIY